MDPLTLRVAARYQVAREFSSPEALKDYLQKHPKADPKRHTVQKSKEKGEGEDHGGKDDGHGDDHGKGHGGFLGGLKGALKSISKGAIAVLKKAPAKTRQFFTDESHRKEVLSSAKETMKKVPAAAKAAPGSYARSLWKTVKHEGEEFKAAGSALRDMAKGEGWKGLDDKQQHAVKTVATHLGITVAAAAFTATGAFAGAAFMVKALGKHVAMKAVSEAMGDIHVIGELGHVGHGIGHLLSKLAADEDGKIESGKITPEDALAILVAKKVEEQIEKLDDKDLAEVLESLSKGSKTASETDTPEGLLSVLGDVESLHNRLQGWVRQAPRILAKAKKDTEGLPSGWVWQDLWVRYWDSFEAYEQSLAELDDRLEQFYLYQDLVSRNANAARDATRIPKGAQIDHVLDSFKFFKTPGGRDHIAYSVRAIEEWMSAFEKWTKQAPRLVKSEAVKAKRKIQRAGSV